MEAQTYDDYDSEDPYYDSDDPYHGTKEEWQRLDDECSKSQCYEIDFSKLTFWGDWQPVDLDGAWGEHETGADFIAMLANLALNKHNAENGISLELGKILRANFYPSCGTTLYISFEVNDPSDGNQTKPYRAVVRHLRADDIEVEEPETNREFIAIWPIWLSPIATQNMFTGKLRSVNWFLEPKRAHFSFISGLLMNHSHSLHELGKILRAGFHPSCGATFYISFEVNDPSESDGNQTKPFRAIVGYLRRDNLTVYSCDPKPSS